MVVYLVVESFEGMMANGFGVPHFVCLLVAWWYAAGWDRVDTCMSLSRCHAYKKVALEFWCLVVLSDMTLMSSSVDRSDFEGLRVS